MPVTCTCLFFNFSNKEKQMKRNLFFRTMALLLIVPLLLLFGSKVRAQYYNRQFEATGVTSSQDIVLDAGAVMVVDDGGYFIFYGKNFTILPGAQILGRDINGNLRPLGEGTGRIVFRADPGSPGIQTLNCGNTPYGQPNTIPALEIDNPAGVKLASTIWNGTTISGSSARIGTQLIFTQGYLFVEGYDMVLAPNATISGADATKYVVTASTGHLVKQNFASSFTFPVGKAVNDYTPAIITPVASNTIHVNVSDYATSASVETGVKGMDRSWNIYGDNTTGALITLQHNSATNLTGFATSANYVSRYGTAPNTTGAYSSVTAWQNNKAGASVVAGSTETNSLAYANIATSSTANESWYTKLSDVPFVLLPDAATTVINKPVSGDLSTNDKVPSGTTYGPANPGNNNPANIPLIVNPDGTYTFTGTSVPGTYTYDVSVCLPGQSSGCPTSQITITVIDPGNPNGNKPTVMPDEVVVKEGTQVNIPVLSNDMSNNQGGSLSNPTIITQPEHGSVVVNPDGTVTYTPTPGYTGSDKFTYQVCDNVGVNNCGSADVIVSVTPNDGTNHPPVVSDIEVKTFSNTPVSGNVIITGHASDPDAGDVISAVAKDTTIAGKGRLVINADGTYTFTPASGFSGVVNIPFKVKDNGGLTDGATLYVLVIPFNLLPDEVTTDVSKPATVDIRTNDDVPAGTTYGTPTAESGNPSDVPLVVNPDGTYTFPGTNVPGTYTYDIPVCPPGQSTGCPIEKVEITVVDPGTITHNNAPSVNPDVTSTKEGTPVIVPVLANDKSNNEGGTLQKPTILVQPDHGTAVVNSDGTVTYTPTPGYTGSDKFTYKVCDNFNNCGTAVVSVEVMTNDATTNHPPTAGDVYALTIVNNPVSGNVLINNAKDVDGNTVIAITQSLTLPEGAFTLSANGNYTFTPTTGFIGNVTIPFTVSDGQNPALTDKATLHIQVVPFNLLPDAVTASVGVPVTGDVATNDDVPAGTTFGPATPSPANPANVPLVVNPDGTYSFPGTSVPGTYTYDIKVCPPGQTTGCSAEQITFTVIQPTSTTNMPTVTPDEASVLSGTSVNIGVLNNDFSNNTDGSLNNPTIVVPPAHGTVVVNADGTVTYTSQAGYTGSDKFTYQVCDNYGKCGTADVNVTVEKNDGLNHAPVVSDIQKKASMGATVTGNVLIEGKASDPDGDVVTAVAQNTTIAGKGTFVLNTDGTYAFTPAAGWGGTITIPFTVRDPKGLTDNGILTIITAVPDLYAWFTGTGTFQMTGSNVINNRNVIVNVGETRGVSSSGLVEVRISKNQNFDLTYDPTATSINVTIPRAINNPDWTMTVTPGYYSFKTTRPIGGANGTLKFGFNLKVKSSVTNTVSATINGIIVDNSGGELTIDNGNNGISLPVTIQF